MRSAEVSDIDMAAPPVTAGMVGWSVARTAGLLGLGDLGAQAITNLRDIDPKRTFSFCVWGVGWGPTLLFYFRGLENLIPGATPLRVGAKVALDQLIMCPLAHIAMFTTTRTVQNGAGAEFRPSSSFRTPSRIRSFLKLDSRPKIGRARQELGRWRKLSGLHRWRRTCTCVRMHMCACARMHAHRHARTQHR